LPAPCLLTSGNKPRSFCSWLGQERRSEEISCKSPFINSLPMGQCHLSE